MDKMLNGAVENAKKWLTEDDLKSKDNMKNVLRAYADECDIFQNMVFEIGLKKLMKHL